MTSTRTFLAIVLAAALPAVAIAQPATSARPADATPPATATASGAPAAGSKYAPMTVARVLKAKDDVDVMLEGTLGRKTGHERYEFKDATGTMTVEIDEDKWPDGKPMSGQRVRLYGETEKKFLSRRIEVDVDRIEPLQ